jgi:preprotein translocase SecE subunit
VYARGGTGGVLLVFALFGSYRLYQILIARSESAFEVLGMQVPYVTFAAAAAFVLLGLVVFLFTFGPQTGLGWIDGKTHRVVDLLIDTEAELKKVSWPDRDDLANSTTAVLVFIVLLGGFLFSVDYLVGLVLSFLRVLPV